MQRLERKKKRDQGPAYDTGNQIKAKKPKKNKHQSMRLGAMASLNSMLQHNGCALDLSENKKKQENRLAVSTTSHFINNKNIVRVSLVPSTSIRKHSQGHSNSCQLLHQFASDALFVVHLHT